ncbi:MAG: sigma-54 dependent transcriptional regulator, partial [Dysgonamonadaceae bacterium]|nr:sigma-54 dependent transcriptional regulator [Dysgonamonadaceae bacterium]
MIKNTLIIEDDITLGLMLKTWLTKKGFNVRNVISIMDAKKQLKGGYIPDLVLSDLRLPDDSGISFLKWVKEDYPDVIFIMMTGYAKIQTAVESIKSGAYDYIAKPLNPEELLKKIQQASQTKEMSKIKKEIKTDSLHFVKGNSSEYKKLYDYVDLVAPTNLSVLIQGQSGVGKEHIARLIHEKSDRKKGPFVAVDCGLLSRELAASDLFGHLKGAFTGAINNKTGHFYEANKGILFLDEIGNLPVDIQVQLLRVLQEKVIKPVGSTREIPVDIRLITATNENLEQALVAGT